MTAETKLLFFAGSSRQGSFNRKLAMLARTIADANGIPSTLAELSDYDLPIYNGDDQAHEGIPDNAVRFKNLMQEHAGIFIAAPEYNASVTPLLKNTLDWVSRVRGEGEAPLHVFSSRLFALGSASPGGAGGLRGLLALRHVLEIGCGALVLPLQCMVPRAAEAFDDWGHLKNKDTQETLKQVILRLARGAKIHMAAEQALD